MKFTKNINFRNFKIKKKVNIEKVRKILGNLIEEKNSIIQSLDKKYKYTFQNKKVKKYKKSKKFRIIGMGGSSLGTQAIYDFLKFKINKDFVFVNNLENKKKDNNKFVNLIVSKSGNTIETIVNSNILIKKDEKNIFITENKKSYLYSLAEKLKAEIIDHNNYIGGRFSVLSEVGMLPAELMGLNPEKFKQFNSIIKNKNFINSLLVNVGSILALNKKGKFNSIVLNYDQKSESLFSWYQQLVAESLGKKSKGILPIVSNMPKDNHSVMQLYLDGFKNNFYTFFCVEENNSNKLQNKLILNSKKYLRNKTLDQIKIIQKTATENVFKKKKLPFRSFVIKKRDEKTLGELFCFFILETILLGKMLKVNPYDQPSVELIKDETKKIIV